MFEHKLTTPAFVFDECFLGDTLYDLLDLTSGAKCEVLYSPKTSPVYSVLESISKELQGLARSSLIEAKMGRSVPGERGRPHYDPRPGT